MTCTENSAAGALTRCHGRAHDKEHPYCDPFQGGGQQAAPFQDWVHHFVLQGNQHDNEHCVKHGEPSRREAERHLGNPGGETWDEREQKAKKYENYTVRQMFAFTGVCASFGLDTALAPPGGQKQNMKQFKKQNINSMYSNASRQSIPNKYSAYYSQP